MLSDTSVCNRTKLCTAQAWASPCTQSIPAHCIPKVFQHHFHVTKFSGSRLNLLHSYIQGFA